MIINKTFLAACNLAAEGNIRPRLANIEVDKNLTVRVTDSFLAGRFTNNFKYLKEDYPDLKIGNLQIKENFYIPANKLKKIRFTKSKNIAILDNTKVLGKIEIEGEIKKLVLGSTDLETERIDKIVLANIDNGFPNIDQFIKEPENGYFAKISIENLEKSLKALKEHGARTVKIFVDKDPLEPILLKGKDYRDYGEYTDKEPESDIIIMPLKE